jgi:hypothetical protein
MDDTNSTNTNNSSPNGDQAMENTSPSQSTPSTASLEEQAEDLASMVQEAYPDPNSILQSVETELDQATSMLINIQTRLTSLSEIANDIARQRADGEATGSAYGQRFEDAFPGYLALGPAEEASDLLRSFAGDLNDPIGTLHAVVSALTDDRYSTQNGVEEEMARKGCGGDA